MLEITDDQLLSQCRAWVGSTASKGVPAEQEGSINPGVIQVSPDNKDTAGRAMQQRLPTASLGQQPAASKTLLNSFRSEASASQGAHADKAVSPGDAVPSGQAPSDGGRVMAGATTEPPPSAPNDFCRSLLADLLGEPTPEAGPPDNGVSSNKEAVLSESGRMASGDRSDADATLTEEAGKLQSLHVADGQVFDRGRTALPPVDLGPTLPYSASVGSMRSGKKLSLRERMNLLQSQ